MEKVRVIVEVREGFVECVYAAPFVDVVVVDHDNPSIGIAYQQPENTFYPQDHLSYDGSWFPKDWPQVPYHTPASKTTPAMRQVGEAMHAVDVASESVANTLNKLRGKEGGAP